MPALKGQLGVDLVGKDKDVPLPEDPGDGLQVFLLQNGPGGVVGVGPSSGLVTMGTGTPPARRVMGS